ncbi:MAG: hypothetical protein MK006_03395 [Pirellulales bacterium]|nr:hypothetical protein [Pirellulales bacterium]
MAIEVACQCGARFQIPDHLAGKSAPCPKCGNQLLHTAVNAPVLPPLSTPAPPIPPAVPQPTVNPAQYRINSPAKYTNSNKRWVLIAATVVMVGLATTVFLITQYNQNPESVGTPGLKSADGSGYSDQSMPDGMAQQNSTAVSEADAIGLARQIEEGIKGGNSMSVSQLWDVETLVDRATDPMEKIFPGPREFSEAKQGFKSAFVPASLGWAQQIADAIGFDGSFVFLRSRTYRGYRTALFRLIHSESSGIDYHEMILDKVNGQVRVIDSFIYTEGETKTETIQRAFTLIVKLMKRDGITQTDQLNMQQLQSTYQLGDHHGVIRIYHQLPVLVRNMKRMRIIYMTALLELDETQYIQAFEAFKRDFPADNSIDLLSIDFFTIQEDISNAIACVGRLDKSLGGDPYLDSMRTGIYMIGDNQVKAKEAAERYIQSTPSDIEAAWNLADYAIYFEDHPLLLHALKTLASDHAVEFEDLSTIEAYEAFVRSPEYQQWLQFHNQLQL